MITSPDGLLSVKCYTLIFVGQTILAATILKTLIFVNYCCQNTEKQTVLMGNLLLLSLALPPDLSEAKVALCVIVGNVSDYLIKTVLVSRVFAILNPRADKIAHNASEVLVSWVGNKAS